MRRVDGVFSILKPLLYIANEVDDGWPVSSREGVLWNAMASDGRTSSRHRPVLTSFRHGFSGK
jgi:hypothetical protein